MPGQPDGHPNGMKGRSAMDHTHHTVWKSHLNSHKLRVTLSAESRNVSSSQYTDKMPSTFWGQPCLRTKHTEFELQTNSYTANITGRFTFLTQCTFSVSPRSLKTGQKCKTSEDYHHANLERSHLHSMQEKANVKVPSTDRRRNRDHYTLT